MQITYDGNTMEIPESFGRQGEVLYVKENARKRVYFRCRKCQEITGKGYRKNKWQGFFCTKCLRENLRRHKSGEYVVNCYENIDLSSLKETQMVYDLSVLF